MPPAKAGQAIFFVFRNIFNRLFNYCVSFRAALRNIHDRSITLNFISCFDNFQFAPKLPSFQWASVLRCLIQQVYIFVFYKLCIKLRRSQLNFLEVILKEHNITFHVKVKRTHSRSSTDQKCGLMVAFFTRFLEGWTFHVRSQLNIIMLR